LWDGRKGGGRVSTELEEDKRNKRNYPRRYIWLGHVKRGIPGKKAEEPVQPVRSRHLNRPAVGRKKRTREGNDPDALLERETADLDPPKSNDSGKDNRKGGRMGGKFLQV